MTFSNSAGLGNRRTQPHLEVDPQTDATAPGVSLARSFVRVGRRGGWLVLVGTALAACLLPAAAGAVVERHYEQVSPVDKGDGDIIAEGLKIMASEDGDGAAFESRMLFGDAIGSGTVGRTTYLARRGAGGWSTHAVTPMPRPDIVQVLRGSTRVEMFADDLSNAFVWAYDLPAVDDDSPLLENLYAEDTATGGLRTISKTQQDQLTIFDFLNTGFGGYSADGKHIAFSTPVTPFGVKRLLPEAAAGVQNVYKWDDGVLSVVGLLPDGNVPPAGATVSPGQIKGTMSADGSHLVFTASPDGVAPSQLYLHVDGEKSAWITEPERGNNDKTPANGVTFEGMTPDGKHVFFSSEESLVDADTAPGPDEYRFTYSQDPETDPGNLTLITDDGQAQNDSSSGGGTLVGMSDDARRVYLHESSSTLKLWQEGVSGLTTIDPSVPRIAGSDIWLTLVASMPGFGRVSPDGNWLAYIKDRQMYLYDRAGESLACVSCPSQASVEPTITATGRDYFKGFRPRFLSDDGQVFFSTTGALVAGDTNGVADVYEYDGQTDTLSLLTTGKGSEPAMLADASRSGDDVFVVTRQQLVASDRDGYVDLYDIRVGAAPPGQPVDVAPACEGDGCQGALSGTPGEGVLGSLSLESDPAGASARVRLTVRSRASFRGTVGLLRVRLARGRIAWNGRGLASGTLRRTSPGTARLRLRLAKRARVQLKRSGRYSTVVRLRFRAGDGRTASRSVRLTFRAATKNGGR